MVARPRKIGKKDLPPNLYKQREYFSYKHPVTRKFISLGVNRDAAIDAAIRANSLLVKSNKEFDKILGSGISFLKFLDDFTTLKLPERNLKEKTIQDYKSKVAVIKKEPFAKKYPKEIDVFDISEFLKKFPPTQSNRYRSLLSLAFRYAIAEGLTKENPSEITIRRKEKVKRKRLTLEGYKAVWGDANIPIKNAMTLALHTLQRREDISILQRKDIKNGFICIKQIKTDSLVKIAITALLQRVLNQCQDGVISPYIVHQPYKSNKARRGRRVSPDSLTKGFSKAREKSGYYIDLLSEERPTFHEIRALGAELYRKAGWVESEIQKLLGHKTESETRKYLSRHDINWNDIEPVYAGLSSLDNW